MVICFTSYLKRAIHTLELLLQEMSYEHVDCIKSWKLNERHYGAWQEQNKDDIKKKVGQKQFVAVRRGYDTPPPPLSDDDPRVAQNDSKYKYIDLSSLPKSESLKDTRDRTLNYYYQNIVPKLCLGKTVLISAHGNSLRSLVMAIESLSSQEIVKVEIPTAEPIVYVFDKTMNLKSKILII